MAKAREKRCKKCKEVKADCKCPKKGWYGIHIHDDDDDNDDIDIPTGGDDGGMSEAVAEPRADKLEKMSGREKRKSLSDFKAHSDEAKKRQQDKETKDDLALTRMKKGIRFYDAKGSGYMKGGKKVYD